MLNSILTSISVNLTICESVLLVSFAVIVWFGRKDKPYLLVFYGVFLILYITLLRREPGYNENIRLYLKLWPDADVWAGNLLNVVLYIPFGWAVQRWKQSRKISIGSAFLLSACCELLQYVAGRGMTDVNDILFNTIGSVVGVYLAKTII